MTDARQKTPRPRTAEAILALPEGPAFGASLSRLPDGRLVQVPIDPALAVFYSSDDDIVSCVDADGMAWALGLYADGRWFRQRRG